MARNSPSLSFRVKCLLIRHPVLANRLMGLLGSRRVESLARRAAIRAARRAYTRVPFYHELFKAHGLDSERMQRLTWKDFKQLPTSDKAQTRDIPVRDLLDTLKPSPAADALIGRSSGTSGAPVFWQTGWDELWLIRAAYWRWLRDIDSDRRRTAVIVSMAIDGGDLAGQLALFPVVSLKEQTRWPFQTFPGGENADDLILLIRWLIQQDYDTLFLGGFPGSIERLLDRVAYLRSVDPAAAVDWSKFRRIRVVTGGQIVSGALRKRIQREMGVAPCDLIPLYASSDSGQLILYSTPFTLWLEGVLETHPQLYDALGIELEHRTKPLMECITSLSVYTELDEEDTMLLTSWKHRPLIRYRTHDLAWMRPSQVIVRTLDREMRGWRRDFARAGYGRGHVPKVATLGIILGRADDVCIINAANVSPDILRDALDASDILPRLHHFKHDTDETHPNVYLVYLELNDTLGEADRSALAAEWKPELLSALVSQPAASDLAAAHHANPIELEVFVRSRGEDEFEGDDQYVKKRYVPRPRRPAGTV